MNVSATRTWQEDLAKASSLSPVVPQGGLYLVTGASGLIGSALVDMLLYFRNKRGADMRVVAAGRDTAKLETRFARQDGVSFLAYDARRPFEGIREKADFIVHAASNASPDLYVKDPCGTISANVLGMRDILEYACSASSKKVLYVSSSEVYGVRQHKGPAKEDDYGRVDPLETRSSYAEGKRAAESLCAAYAAQRGLHVSVVRPGHIYGPTATPNDHRVSSEFPRLAARGKSIVLKSAGSQKRSYCHCLDCATAMLAVLAFGENASAYNIANPVSAITIREMAEIVAAAGGVELEFSTASAAEKAAFNPMDDSSLDAGRLISLGWRGTFSAQEGLTRTVAAIKEMLGDED